MVTKSRNPDYKQILAYVPKDLLVAFKTKLAAEQKEQSEIIEELIRYWLAKSS